MRLIVFICSIIGAGCTLFAQSVNISGKITASGSGNPIAGATVTLAGKNLTTTTDSDGNYALIEMALMPQSTIAEYPENITMRNGIVSISLSTAAPVTIERYDMNGSLLEKLVETESSAGNYEFCCMPDRVTMKMMLLRITTGRTTTVFRYLPVARGNQMLTSVQSTASVWQKKYARIEEVVDTLKITASNYVSTVHPVTSYKSTIDIALDSLALDKFSFFVTSLKALQELSGRSNGFGGDLRFGKTGKGAGLLGADSICECIAERSMPGSRVKQWRAFLSVSEGPDGKQVDAIDRIGEGPWYDRLGRSLAPTIDDLLNTRPENGDPTIKNDLPNEDGVPNHQPDPNLSEVDNHHFITGSKTDGTLYNATSTCADWTTTDSNEVAGRPRCGFSWPRGSGGGTFHWISGLNVHGCGAGIQITEQNGGVGAIIGAGGGYGGFYCFARTP